MAQDQGMDEYAILESIHESVVAYDLDHRVTFWNPAAEKLYGWTREEAIGRNVDELLQWDLPAPLSELEARLFETGRCHCEFEQRTKSGSTACVETSWAVRRNRGGEPVAVIATSWDITDRRKAEQALKRTELQYRSLFDHMPIAFWQVDISAARQVVRALREEGMTDFRAHFEAHPEAAFRLIDAMQVTDTNEEAVRLLGARDRSDLIGPLSRTWTDMERYVQSVEERLSGAPFSTAVAKIDTFDGRRLDILSCVAGGGAFSDKDDISLIGAIDITDRVRAFEELAKSEAKYRSLFHQMPIAVIQTNTTELLGELGRLRAEGVKDLDAYMDAHPEFLARAKQMLRIEELNERAVELLGGAKPSDLVGSINHYSNPHTFRRSLIARFAGAENFSEELRKMRIDGRTVDVFYTSTFSPALNELGIGLVSLMDLTRATEAEAKVRQLQAEFAHAARVATLGELTGSIAHEVNQPLAAITMNAAAVQSWLAGKQPNLEEARELAGRIACDAHRAADIIARIRAMASRKPPAYEPTSLNRIVEDVLSFLKHELTAHGVEAELDLARNLPELLADQTQLKQVLMNLAVNAIQAMGASETQNPTLTLRTRKVSDCARVEVEDNGPGIPPDAETRLFDSFFTTKQDGLGIGLSICKSIIEAHGGTIMFAPGRSGARFELTLPSLVAVPGGCA